MTSPEPDVLSRVAAALENVIDPLRLAGTSDLARSRLLAALGWNLQELTGFPVSRLIADAGTIATTALDLAQAAATPPQDFDHLQQLTGDIGALFSAVRDLSQLAADPAVSLPQDAVLALEKLGEELAGFLVAQYLISYHPRVFHVARLLTLARSSSDNATNLTAAIAGDAGTELRAAVAVPQIQFDHLHGLLTDPLGALKQEYLAAGGLSTPDSARALAALLFDRLWPLSAATGATVTLGDDGTFPAASDPRRTVALRWPNPLAAGAGDIGLMIELFAATEGGARVEITPSSWVDQTWYMPGWALELSGSAQAAAFALSASGPTLPGGVGSLTLNLSLTQQLPQDQPAAVIGPPEATRIEIGSLTITGELDLAPSKQDITLGLAVGPSALVIAKGDGDGFLADVLPDAPLVIQFAFGLTWSRDQGLRFTGGHALEVDMDVHASFLGVTITSVSIAVMPDPSGLEVTIGATGGLTLGPLTAIVSNVGISGNVVFPPGGGNLGPADLRQLSFKPPDGIDLALDADPVSGVGFIAFEEADARYLGALALAVGDVSIDAVGVLDTRLPGGAQGYSLVVVASATFPPVQLGFGFSLDGIGGLVGVNRTADVPSLQAAARAGQLDDLMFPPDIIHRAPQVAANLAREFPAAQGHFIIGPAVRLAWGADGMVEAAVGVFIELSDTGGGISLLRVALLGSVHLTLPEPIDPVADLTLDVLGLVDLPAKTLSLDAGLRNSTIAGFPLTGQAALRAGWGADPAFVFAIGGFNPHFAAPAGFPSLQRVTLAIGDDSASLVLSSYLALTSNTLQLGCAADLHAVQGSAAVAASLSFDALVQFKPFGLIVYLTITATVLLNGNAIMTLDLDLHLTGPDPWQVTGEASFHFLFCSFSVPVAITVGPQPPPATPVTVDLDSNLTTALAAPGSWQTGPPPGQGLVKVRAQDKAHPAVHPLGSLTVRQHAVPLGQRVDRYGPDLLERACTYEITAPTLGGQPAQATDAKDFFAPAQFLTMHSDAEKLSAPSFEQMIAGATLGSTDLTVPRAPGSTQGTDVVVDTPSAKTWNMLILDSPNPVTTTGGTATASTTAPAATVVSSSQQVTLDGTMLAAQLPGAAAAVNGAGGRGQALYTRPGLGNGIAVEQPAYAIASMNLAAFAPARLSLLRIATAAAAPSTIDTGQRGQDWQVVYASEMAGS